MNSQKTLEELGREYSRQADILSEKIEKLNKRMKTEDVKNNSRRKYLIKCDISTLYAQRRDARQTADRLINYYRTSERRPA